MTEKRSGEGKNGTGITWEERGKLFGDPTTTWRTRRNPRPNAESWSRKLKVTDPTLLSDRDWGNSGEALGLEEKEMNQLGAIQPQTRREGTNYLLVPAFGVVNLAITKPHVRMNLSASGAKLLVTFHPGARKRKAARCNYLDMAFLSRASST